MKKIIVCGLAAISLAAVCGLVSKDAVADNDAFYDKGAISAQAAKQALAATPVATASSDGVTNSVVITLTDLESVAKADKVLVRCWVSESDGGAPSAVASNFVVSSGVEIQQITDKADYWVLTSAAGTATCTVTDTPSGTNYFCTAIGGGAISSTVMLFDAP